MGILFLSQGNTTTTTNPLWDEKKKYNTSHTKSCLSISTFQSKFQRKITLLEFSFESDWWELNDLLLDRSDFVFSLERTNENVQWKEYERKNQTVKNTMYKDTF